MLFWWKVKETKRERKVCVWERESERERVREKERERKKDIFLALFWCPHFGVIVPNRETETRKKKFRRRPKISGASVGPMSHRGSDVDDVAAAGPENRAVASSKRSRRGRTVASWRVRRTQTLWKKLQQDKLWRTLDRLQNSFIYCMHSFISFIFITSAFH